MEPQRTCLGCRRRDDKSQVVRLALVRGAVCVDAEAVLPGRGAYVHPGCVEALMSRRGVIGRALRTSVDPNQVALALSAVRPG